MVITLKTVANTKFIDNQAMINAPMPFNMEDGEYMISIEPKKKKRSIDQNSFFWKLLCEISKVENSNSKDINNLYINLLEMAGTKYTTVIVKHDDLDNLKLIVKHIKVVKQQIVKNELYDTVYAFNGSSNFSTLEMSNLIETTLRYAEAVGVENVKNYWEGVLNNK